MLPFKIRFFRSWGKEGFTSEQSENTGRSRRPRISSQENHSCIGDSVPHVVKYHVVKLYDKGCNWCVAPGSIRI